MNAAAQESSAPANEPSRQENWSITRWVAYVMLAFAFHMGLILVFGNRKPVVPKAVVNAPEIQLASSLNEWQLLDDPSLFALPHVKGFAAATWLQLPRVEFAPFRWTEPPELLNLPVEKLGGAFLQFAKTNAVPKIETERLTPVQTTRVALSDPQTNLKQHSTVSAGGGIANRRWLNSPALLRSWPASDLLTNSVVRIVVDPDGQVFSPALLPPGSGSKVADQYALEIARSARFAAIPRNAAKQMVGALVFEWHTVPAPDTNAPAAKP